MFIAVKHNLLEPSGSIQACNGTALHFSSYSDSTLIYSTHIYAKLGYRQFLGAFAKIRKSSTIFVMSVCLPPHGATGLPMDGFSWKSIFYYFSKICGENFQLYSYLKRITGTLHEDQYIFLIIYRSNILVMRMFQTKFVEKIKTHISRLVTLFFSKNRAVETYSRVGKSTDANMAHAYFTLGT
jgi:hypothetical protein